MFESVAANIAVFIAASAVIWKAGAALSFTVKAISEKTGIGKAFAGILFLGGATSLPELTTSITAASNGLANLAGSNILGGISMQIAVLALVDKLTLKGKALTSMAPNSALLMAGVVLIVMTTLATAAIAAGELWSFHGVGFWPVLLFVFYLVTLKMVHRYESRPQWEPIEEIALPKENPNKAQKKRKESLSQKSLGNLWTRFVVCAVFVFAGGFLATKSAEAIIQSAGIDESIVGATLMALATSLPEVTTTWGAAKAGAFSMAVGSIMGTNALEVALLLPADVAYREGPIIGELSNRSMFLGALGGVLTAVYLWGVLERRDKTIWNMGVDSAVILILYGAGLAVYSTI